MKKAPINQIILVLQDCFHLLNMDISDQELEKLALLIHDCMAGRKRKFHTLEHIFTVTDTLKNPLQIIAGLFHDIVYFQVDNGFPTITEPVLKSYLRIKGSEVSIKTRPKKEKHWEMLLQVFEFEEEHILGIFAGLNEFASALIAVKALESHLNPTQLLTIATCIEATIPFRGNNSDGKTHFEILNKRLTRLNQALALEIPASKIEEIISLAVELANQDVENFSDIDTARFLDNTWMLIYESNTNLNIAENYAYSIVRYREGLMKSEGFLQLLKPENIFHQYKNTPEPSEFDHLQRQASENIAIAREYMAVKLITATILEALAMTTGGDVPLSMFSGIIRTDDEVAVERAEDFLTLLDENQKKPCNEKVWRLLEFGRTKDTSFDMKRSPLSAYLYQAMGTQNTQKAVRAARDLFAKKISYDEFLQSIKPSFVISEIAQAIAHLAVTRRKALEKYFS
jgi:hypothetical protein